jgi:hypothetical protein
MESIEHQNAIKAKAINVDARNFEKAIEQTMVFHTCAICGTDDGLVNLVPLQQCKDQIARSAIPQLFTELTKPLTLSNATKYETNFANAVSSELPHGLLLGARHVCKECLKQLPKKEKNDNARSDDDSDDNIAEEHDGDGDGTECKGDSEPANKKGKDSSM